MVSFHRAGIFDQRTGEMRSVGGITVNITDRKISEERIQKLNESLADNAAQLCAANRELNERSEQLESLLAERTVFLSSMSHELRTPLHSISGFLELLLEERESGMLNDRQRRYLKNIEGSAQHLNRVVSDVLDLSRIAAGRLRLSLEVVDLSKICDQVVTALLPVAEESEVGLEFALSDESGIFADRERVQQVLANIVGNAIKFTPAGGKVKVSIAHEDGRALACVEDTGIGIPAEDHVRIFQEFEQVHQQGFRPRTRGSGLGLAITRKLLDMQGGGVSVESKVGQGSTFRVWFPSA
ncbi:MAG: HAMP domain-containing sensor histidine kinase [Bryobacterales bacterium]|nr:HAMP domain-containing sensor histidine kinase [Bryobacterales bacterium]